MTSISVALEQGPDGSTFVHCLSIPGCSATGPSPEEALDALPDELGRWLDFLAARGESVPPPETELEIAVDEWVRTDADVAAGASDACFEAERLPLTEGELTLQLHRLGDLRGELLTPLRRLPDSELDRFASAGWSLRRILEELARAQWWTLTRLGASPMAEVPERTLGRLDTAMVLVVQQLTALPREAREHVLELDGELWTPRKVLRRLLWLEWTLGRSALHVLMQEVRA